MNDGLQEKRMAYLHEVGLRGGIRRAAEVLGINPSAISRQLASLERSLHMPLLERHGRNVVLTEAGRLLASHYAETSSRRDTLVKQLGDLRNMRRGTVRVRIGQGMVEDVAEYVLAPFATEYPDIFIEISTGDFSTTLQMLLKGEADMAVSFGPISNAALMRRSFPRGPLCAIVLPSHPLAAQLSVLPQALAEHRLILMNDSFGMQRYLNAMFENTGTAVHPAYRCNLLSAALVLCRANLGVAFMTAQSLGLQHGSEQLIAVPIDHEIARTTQCHLLRSSDRRFTPAAEHLWQLLTRCLSHSSEKFTAI